MSAAQSAILSCDMCGKSQDEVYRLIAAASPDRQFNICDECVAMSFSILATDPEWLDATLRQAHVVKEAQKKEAEPRDKLEG